jgi:hypothetical protein
MCVLFPSGCFDLSWDLKTLGSAFRQIDPMRAGTEYVKITLKIKFQRKEDINAVM